jgi:transposase-like protein
MTRYSQERKEAVMKKMLPPHNMTVTEVARTEGISEATLYNWRSKAKQSGVPVPGQKSTSESWSADAKLAVVIETTPLSETELGQYCREKGLLPEQVKRWKAECLQGFQTSESMNKSAREQAKADKAEIKTLKKELREKEKALAEAAAILVLRKKLTALWGEDSEDN